jgi:hypothetical protein
MSWQPVDFILIGTTPAQHFSSAGEGMVDRSVPTVLEDEVKVEGFSTLELL